MDKSRGSGAPNTSKVGVTAASSHPHPLKRAGNLLVAALRVARPLSREDMSRAVMSRRTSAASLRIPRDSSLKSFHRSSTSIFPPAFTRGRSSISLSPRSSAAEDLEDVARLEEIERMVRENYAKSKAQLDAIEKSSELVPPFDPRSLAYSVAKNEQYYRDITQNKGNSAYVDQVGNLSKAQLFGLRILPASKEAPAKGKAAERVSSEVETRETLAILTDLFFAKRAQRAAGSDPKAQLFTFDKKTKSDFGIIFRELEKAIMLADDNAKIVQALSPNPSDEEETRLIKQIIAKAIALHNKEGRSPQSLPISFWKYIVLCETRLIKHQIDKIGSYVKHAPSARANMSNSSEVLMQGLLGTRADVRNRRLAIFKDDLAKYVGAYQCVVEIPAERAQDQLRQLAGNTSLNMAQKAPHVLPCFISKVEGRKIAVTASWSYDQMNMLTGIDSAIAHNLKLKKPTAKPASKKAILYKQSEVVMRAGTGKSYVMDRLKVYTELYPKGIFNINLNSSPEEITAVFSTDGKDRLIVLDEVFFYHASRNFLPMLQGKNPGLSASSKPQDLERAMLKAIRDLRRQGATVIMCGASKSVDKVKIELTRVQKKIEDLDRKIEAEKEKNQGPLQQKNILLSLQAFYSHYGVGEVKYAAIQHVTLTQNHDQLTYFQHCIAALKQGPDTQLEAFLTQEESQGPMPSDQQEEVKAAFLKFCETNAAEIPKLINARLRLLESQALGSLNSNIEALEAKKRELEIARIVKGNQLQDLEDERAAALKRLKKDECEVVYNPARTSSRPGAAQLHEVINRSLILQAGQRVQYILPDFKISEDGKTEQQASDDLSTALSAVQNRSGASVIIVPCKIKGENGKQELGYRVFCKNGNAAPPHTGMHSLTPPLTRGNFEKFLKEKILRNQSEYTDDPSGQVSILSIFTGDPSTVIGGDYAEASILTADNFGKQIIHFQRDGNDAPIIADHIVQYTKRNRADEDKLVESDIERIVIIDGGTIKSKEELLARIEADTKSHDKEYVRVYLQEKIADLADVTDSEPALVEKRAFYQGLLDNLDREGGDKENDQRLQRASSSLLYGDDLEAVNALVREAAIQEEAWLWTMPGEFAVEEGADVFVSTLASSVAEEDWHQEGDRDEAAAASESEKSKQLLPPPVFSSAGFSSQRERRESVVPHHDESGSDEEDRADHELEEGRDREISFGNTVDDDVVVGGRGGGRHAQYKQPLVLSLIREDTTTEGATTVVTDDDVNLDAISIVRSKLDFAQSADLVFGGDLKKEAGGWRDVHYDTAKRQDIVVDKRIYSAGEKKQTIKSFISAYAEISANIKTKLSDQELTSRDKKNLLELELHKKSALFALTCPGLNQEQFKTLCNAKTMDIKIDGEKTVKDYFVEAVTTLQNAEYRASFLKAYESQLKVDLGQLHERKKVSEQDMRPGKSISARQIQNMSIEQKISLIENGGR